MQISSFKEMTETKRKVVKVLLERGTFKIIRKEDIPANANALPGRLILTKKSAKDAHIKFKARCVIGGHRDN